MTEPQSADQRKNGQSLLKFGIWLPLAMLVALVLAVVAGGYSRRMMLIPSALSSSRMAATPAGTALNLIVEVAAMPSPNVLDASLLSKQDSAYVRTADDVRLHWQAGTPVIMGKRDDVHPGAVLAVSAIAWGKNTNQFDVRSLTVLTGYVQVY